MVTEVSPPTAEGKTPAVESQLDKTLGFPMKQDGRSTSEKCFLTNTFEQFQDFHCCKMHTNPSYQLYILSMHSHS